MTKSENPLKINKLLKWLILIILVITSGFFLLWPKIMVKEAVLYATVAPVNVPEGLTVTNPHCSGLEVRICGPERVMKHISQKDLIYEPDLSRSSAGYQYVNIDPGNLSLPSGVKVVGIEPGYVIFSLEKEVRKTVPVSVSIEGNPASGYVVSGAVATPLSVDVRGPKKILERIQKIFTKPVDVTGVKKSFKMEITLSLDESVEIDSPAKMVTAEIFIEEKVETRKFEDIFIEGRNTSYQYTITPSSITITVKGPVSLIEKLEPGQDMDVYVDLKDLKPGVYVRCAVIRLPVKTTLLDVHPEVFGVTLGKS